MKTKDLHFTNIHNVGFDYFLYTYINESADCGSVTDKSLIAVIITTQEGFLVFRFGMRRDSMSVYI